MEKGKCIIMTQLFRFVILGFINVNVNTIDEFYWMGFPKIALNELVLFI
jgi:hypothetical protein